MPVFCLFGCHLYVNSDKSAQTDPRDSITEDTKWILTPVSTDWEIRVV
jgi:hypothetical protein